MRLDIVGVNVDVELSCVCVCVCVFVDCVAADEKRIKLAQLKSASIAN